MDAIRLETTISEAGIVHVPDLAVGEHVEVIVLRIAAESPAVRKGGWAKGRVKILPGFDDPIPGLEDLE